MKRQMLMWLGLMLGLALAGPARADVKLPNVLGSHMVLQRDMPVPVWGWADAGEEVTVEFAGQKETATADDKGRWKVVLKAMKANDQPQDLTVTGKGSKVKLEDVLVGEVWVGSGQSNMEWSVQGSKNSKQAIENADQPKIRLFNIPHTESNSPSKDVKAKWQVCTPKTIPQFSGVLYFFALDLQKELNVPVGLVHSSWGGSAIEPWIVKEKSSGKRYNAMIAPLQPFAIRGVLWYQGEANVGQGMKYFDHQKDLIEGWRKTWGSDFPFYYVQIAPWSNYPKDKLPELWEAQVASLKLPKTGMIVVTDIVDKISDIHPANKQVVGHRLALLALAQTYGKKDIVYSGPLYKSMKVEGNKVRLTFAHTGTGLKTRDEKAPSEFEIASEDGKFVPARAEIDGKTVVVWAEGVDQPTQVRFGWSNIANPNLVNSAGLPASPFRTKDWKGVTGE